MTVNSPGSTLQCDTWLWDDMPLNSPGGSALQCDNDFERPQTQISRSGHCLTLNISEMAKDTAITMEGE